MNLREMREMREMRKNQTLEARETLDKQSYAALLMNINRSIQRKKARDRIEHHREWTQMHKMDGWMDGWMDE
jgi:hypothetical protein